jgi:hypothetical protein
MQRPVGLLARAALCLAVPIALALPGTAVAEIVPHRADYSLRLGPAPNALKVGSAVQDISADCGGWKLKRDILTEINLTASWKIAVGSKLVGEEARGGSAFRYQATQLQNGVERKSQGKVQRTPKEVRAEIVVPAGPFQLTLPIATLMPVGAISHLVERLKAGATSFPALMFDAEVITDGFLVDVETIDAASLRPARPAERRVELDGKSWAVAMTFTRARQQEQRPLFRVTGQIWDSGILDRLTVETGLVAVTADLQALEVRKTPNCPRS